MKLFYPLSNYSRFKAGVPNLSLRMHNIPKIAFSQPNNADVRSHKNEDGKLRYNIKTSTGATGGPQKTSEKSERTKML